MAMGPCKICGRWRTRDAADHLRKYGHTPVYGK